MTKFDKGQDVPPIGTDSYPPNAKHNAEEIDALFSTATPSKFIDSIHDWWQEKGFLTAGQYNKLKEICEREDTAGHFTTSDDFGW